ncbi:hypothetical protein P4O66_001123 [Electrophorus voltai]|uniref:Uncharacterized protein n=1 Tax=Electrophorus voltai TaxID=2609070 RepID=A0AAD8ZA19_9TELE|nr:hypothetical protein P4O66_001123 [Electrophorus voltai]
MHHQTRDSKSPGAAGTWASRCFQKKKVSVYFDDDEISGKRQESVCLDQRCRGSGLQCKMVTPPVPMAIPQATRPDPGPVPGVRDPARPDPGPVPGVRDPARPEHVPGVRDPARPEHVPGVRDPARLEHVPGVRDPARLEHVPGVRDPAHPEHVPSVRDPARPDPVPVPRHSGCRPSCYQVCSCCPTSGPAAADGCCCTSGPTSSRSWSGRSHSTSPCASCQACSRAAY